MVTHDVESGQVARDGPIEGMAPGETAERPKNVRWYIELPYVLSKLAFAFDRLYIIIGVIAIGAVAVAYWGAYTERYSMALGAMAMVALAMLAWTAVTIRMLWVIAKGIVKWRASRRAAPLVSESTENAPG